MPAPFDGLNAATIRESAASEDEGPLESLAASPERLSPLRLWRALHGWEREEAIRAFLRFEPDRRTRICELIGKARHFRPATVQRWPDEKVSNGAASIPIGDPRLAMDLLVAWHLAERTELLGNVLDGLGIPNEKGEAEPDVLKAASVDAALLQRVFDNAVSRFGRRKAIIYAAALVFEKVGFVDQLRDWLARLSVQEGEAPPLELMAESEVEGLEAPETEPSLTPGFTTLDKVVILSAVDAAQEVEGALTEDEVDDLIDEVIQLNGRRHRSYFHAGFRDSVFDRVLREELPAENVDRARWYWAGAIQGWARSESWPSILSALDNRLVVRELGDGRDEPSIAAALHVVRALRMSDRATEIPSFVAPDALRASARLFSELLDAATDLLRSDIPSAARGILDLLMEAVRSMEEAGFSASNPLFLEARRREAHCLRQMGEHMRAKELLRQLLDTDPDPNIHAMVQADLGLIAGGFRQLAEVYLPGIVEDRDLKLEALERGRSHFERSVANDVPYAAHGHYCLGVLALGREEYRKAESHLERARAHFRARPQRYSLTQLQVRTDLYFALAACQQLEPGRLSHAARLIESALRGGEAIPAYLLPATVDALTLGQESDLTAVVEAILEAGDDSALDALSRTSAAVEHCAPLAIALLGRAHRQNRRGTERADDLRASLDGYLALRDDATASEILDELESLAMEGVGDEEFIELLGSANRYQPAWTIEDAAVARARCFESSGEYLTAKVELEQLFHRLASRESMEACEDAAAILDRIRGYGLPTEQSEPLARRLGALQETLFPPKSTEDVPTPAPVRVLFVGGDERQAKQDEAIRTQLRDEYPHVTVSFLHTGWSGNWRPALDDVRRALVDHDALVIMRFIRTELGKQIRKNCRVPWRFCWGPGRETIVRAIVEAAAAADVHVASS